MFFSALLAGTVFRTVPSATVAKELLTTFAKKMTERASAKKDLEAIDAIR